ncbi:MAG TPA: helix-turn-helix domain-containing protein [Thermoanaerobaculia bacterium]|nr:helix-turn-helix domain-containing protein [Thermoanaerobaculia bacterium]
MTRVLIVNGDEAVRRDLAAFLVSSPRFEVVEASNASEAARELASSEFDVVLAPARLPEGEDLATLMAARGENPAPAVLVIAGALDAPFGSEAPPGGIELLTKPLRRETVRTAVDRAAERGRLRRENASLKHELNEIRSALGRVKAAGDNGNGHADGPLASGNGNGNGHAFREWIASLPESFDLRSLEADVEREIVRRALASSAGVAAQAARKLGLSRSDLAYKLRRLGIARERLES